MQDRVRLNRALGKIGLGQLEDGAGLVSQLAYLVQDHEHFRVLLATCEPELRVSMYESMKPYLRFQARTLDQYISDSARMAEQRQWAIVGKDGQMHPFRAPEIRTDADVIADADADIIADAIAASEAKGQLILTCKKCTRQAAFPGRDKSDAVRAAREAGWSYDEIKETGFEVCPKCPAIREFID